MRTIPTQKRRDELAAALVRDGHIDASAQAAAYGVSRETIRKDLIYLEKLGLAKKGYGGAVVSAGVTERSFSEKYGENQAAKQRIAAAALELIHPGDIVILDSGSTVYALARLLAMKPMDVTVFTNSLRNAQALGEAGLPTFLLGGQVRLSSGAVTGPWAVRQLSELRAKTAFLGTSGWRDSRGPCVESFEEAQVKKAMIEVSERAVLMADASKWEKRAMLEYARWQELTDLITDGATDAQRESLAGKVRVTVV